MSGSALGLTLPPGFEPLAEHTELVEALVASLELIEQELAESLVNADALAQATTRHLLDAGGKRVRPLLTLLSALLGDPQVATGQVAAPNAEARRIAVVMELTHLATLYHDDVMDEADLRRGAPTAHHQWSNSVAILAGDLIFARASQGMADMGEEAIKVHADTFEALVMGQLWETVGPHEDDDALEHYLKVINGKTASLIAASARLGALFGGCTREQITLMEAYGSAVGMAFQLADDIIDLVADEAVSGKVPGTDLKERVPTLPVLLLRQAAEHGDTAAVAALELIDGPLETDAQLGAAVAAISQHAVIDQAWELTRSWAEKAIDTLTPLADSPVKAALEAFAHYVVSRQG